MAAHSIKILVILTLEKLRILLPDTMYLKLQFRLRMGYYPDFNNPKTFSEKLQWLKLHNQNPLYTKLVDKYDVKYYVAKKIGSQYIIETIGVWNDVESIQWDILPNSFVLKTTHGGGSSGVIVCPNKFLFNRERAKIFLKKSLKQDIYKTFREWPYKNVRKRIIAERFMKQVDGSPLIDYKFFCFNGIPRFLYVRRNTFGNKSSLVNFIYPDWTAAPFWRDGDIPSSTLPEKPQRFDKMLNIASKLSEDLVFARIDLYEINGDIYFSEITFFPASGLLPFNSIEWDRKLGDMLSLPQPFSSYKYDR
ncbi:hypothetical protein LD006_05300 [Bacteroides xylanisolvens]|uniref:ATP-grasp fold amidoligase family protein n=1 Tax=Bacteroides xylanisolvens TaxID=371601 RepID=UPI001CDD893C|nr:ATP-grasp fold amidoligase family protein [Bacteroides xylanisolvens]MCA4563332.1 hypothetical protein [Bacteroides xylanisolvens]